MHVCSAWRALQVNQALAAVLLERVKPDRGVCRLDGGGVESYPPIRFVCADSLGHIQGHEKHSLHPHSPLRAEIHQPCVGGNGAWLHHGVGSPVAGNGDGVFAVPI